LAENIKNIPNIWQKNSMLRITPRSSPLLQQHFKFVILTCFLSFNITLPAQAEGMNDLIDNTQFQLESYLDFFTDSPAKGQGVATDTRPLSWFNRLNIETQADLKDGVILNLSADALLSVPNINRSAFSRIDNESEFSRFFDINTANIIFEYDSYDLLIGKAQTQLKYAETYSVLDRFNVSNAANPLHLVKMGAWQAKGTFYLDELVDYEDQISLAVLPFDDKGGSVPKDSRWRGSSGDSDFAGTVGELTPQYRSSKPKDWGIALQYDGVRDGYDFTLGLHRGPSPYPVVRSEFSIVNFALAREDFKLYPTAHSAYGGIALTKDNTKYFGEFLLQDVLNGKDDDVIRTVAGVTYKETNYAARIGLDEISPTIEYGRERVINEPKNSLYTKPSEEARPFRNTISLTLKLVYDSDYTFKVGSVYNLIDGDNSQNVNFEYKYDDNSYYYLRGIFFDGKNGSPFGRWAENDAITVGFVRKF
jgi:hypothetical protein